MFSADVWTNELDAKFIPIQILSGFTSGTAVRLVDKISKIYCFSKRVLEFIIFRMAGIFYSFKFISSLFNRTTYTLITVILSLIYIHMYYIRVSMFR